MLAACSFPGSSAHLRLQTRSGWRCRNVVCEASPELSSQNNKGATANRLSKVLASAGIASRRGAEELIFAGKVEVNGEVIKKPETRVVPIKDKVKVNGELVQTGAQEYHYFVLNKPSGYVCTSNKDAPEAKGKHIVLDLFQEWMIKWQKRQSKDVPCPRLFTVGRLDIKSWGLILITNDGNWAQKVAHPSSDITKEYVVHANRLPNRKEYEALVKGCVVQGHKVVPVSVSIEDNFVRIVVAEGRNREVREIFNVAGLEVKSLKRVRIGGYRMPRGLKVGEFRTLSPKDLQKVMNKTLQETV